MGKIITLKNSEETITLRFVKDIEYSKAFHSLKQFTTQEGFFERFETKDLREMMRTTKKKDPSSLS